MMKKLFMLALAIVVCSGMYAQYDERNVEDYINNYKEVAINEMIHTGVPAAITLAQGILETDAGSSDLVKQSNNHFGIKCKSDWVGSVVYHDDDAKGECFRSYITPEDSYKDHSDFLKNRPNYAFLFDLDPTDYEGWAKGLKKAGYATNPAYANILIKIIVDNSLQDFTLIALQRAQQREQELFALKPTNADNVIVNTSANVGAPPALDKKEVTSKIAQTIIAAPTYPTGEFEINQTKVIYAASGTSLFALANNYGIAYKKLLEYNDLTDKDILDKSQLIFLSKKSKKGAVPFHIVAANETMEDIAQAEGVVLKSLLEYNRIPNGAQPAAGEKIYLQSNSPVTPKLAPLKNDNTASTN